MHAHAQPLSAAEACLIAIVGIDLVFLPWWFGGMTIAGQVTALALSLAALGCGIWSRCEATGYGNGAGGPWKRLAVFPPFWLGLAVLALVLVQLANPAWEFRSSAAGWHLRRVEHVGWLPHGVRAAPYAMVNAWRWLVINGAVWLLVCALWLGVTRRRTARLLLTLVTLNAALFAAVFLVQRLTGSTRMLWRWDAPASYFVAGIIYKNHAGAFLNLGLAACLGLAWWHGAHARQHSRKSHPGFLFGFLALLIFAAQLFTYARAATLLGAALLGVAGLAFALEWLLRKRERTPAPVAIVMALLGLGFVGVCAVSLDLPDVWRRFDELLKGDRTISVTHRQLASRATLDMAEASPVLGHGAASYRFVFPQYQQRYPQIFTRGGTATGRQMFWEHAHNDYAELWAEHGLIGVAVVIALAGCVGFALWRARAYRQPALLLVLAGPVVVAAHAAVDFPFQNPAVLTTAAAAVVLGVRWASFERSIRVPGEVR